MASSGALTSEGLFDYLPIDKIKDAFARSPGNEIASGKLASPESSAALAANALGVFIEQPASLPPIPGSGDWGWPPIAVSLEETAPFPWRPAGKHPWLDAFVETETHIVGIESKRYEPFRSHKKAKFSDAYWRPVWGDAMAAFETVRDQLHSGELTFKRLDAVQLVKHAFGLRTEAVRRGKKCELVYLYAEPSQWSNGRALRRDALQQHVSEAENFERLVSGSEVGFSTLIYKALLDGWKDTGNRDLIQHVENLQGAFDI